MSRVWFVVLFVVFCVFCFCAGRIAAFVVGRWGWGLELGGGRGQGGGGGGGGRGGGGGGGGGGGHTSIPLAFPLLSPTVWVPLNASC